MLNRRAAPKRGGFRSQPELLGDLPVAGSPCIIYIHGFNVDAGRAKAQALELYDACDLSPRIAKGLYLWPATRFGVRSLSRLTYPATIDPARQAGRHLADDLRGNPRFGEVFLVGQSLGALVAVEAAIRWLTFQRGALPRLLLTGAAVESRAMEPSGEFGVPLARREAVMYSPRDPVLRTVFGPGQRLAAPFGPKSPAVGLRGEPETRLWERVDSKLTDHRYWHFPVTGVAISAIARGSPVRTPRTIALREVARREGPSN